MKKVIILIISLIVFGFLLINVFSAQNTIIGTPITQNEVDSLNPETINLNIRIDSIEETQISANYVFSYDFIENSQWIRKKESFFFDKTDFIRCMNKGTSRILCISQSHDKIIQEIKLITDSKRKELYALKNVENKFNINSREIIIIPSELN